MTKNIEDRDLNPSEGDDTPSDGPADKNEGGDEEVTVPKSKLESLKEERENYKKGMLKYKEEAQSEEKNSSDNSDSGDSSQDVSQAVQQELAKEREKEALQEAVDPDSNNFIPELVNDENYNEIINYLPRNIDKSSKTSIIKALEEATTSWKANNGKLGSNDDEASGLMNEKTKNAGAAQNEGSGDDSDDGSSGERRILTKEEDIDNWY